MVTDFLPVSYLVYWYIKFADNTQAEPKSTVPSGQRRPSSIRARTGNKKSKQTEECHVETSPTLRWQTDEPEGLLKAFESSGGTCPSMWYRTKCKPPSETLSRLRPSGLSDSAQYVKCRSAQPFYVRSRAARNISDVLQAVDIVIVAPRIRWFSLNGPLRMDSS
jgi:hypothetical protein